MYWTYLAICAVVVRCVEVEDDSKIEIIEDVFPQAQLETENGTIFNQQLENVPHMPVNQASYEEYIPLDVKSGEYPFYDENPTTEKSRRRKGKKTKPPRESTRRTRYQRVKAHKEMIARREARRRAVKKALATSPEPLKPGEYAM